MDFNTVQLHIRSSHVLNGLPYGYPLYRKAVNPEMVLSTQKSHILPIRKEKVID